MSHSNERGAAERGLRSSALWGTGSRGGESRSSVLWGKGGRGIVTTCLAVCALAAPLAAMADSGKGKGSNATASGYVAPDLLDKAKRNPGEKLRVIVTSTYGASDASNKLKGLGPLSSEKKRLNIVGGVVAELPAALVAKLQGVPGLSVTPDAKLRLAGYGSSQLWPFQSGNASLWT